MERKIIVHSGNRLLNIKNTLTVEQEAVISYFTTMIGWEFISQFINNVDTGNSWKLIVGIPIMSIAVLTAKDAANKSESVKDPIVLGLLSFAAAALFYFGTDNNSISYGLLFAFLGVESWIVALLNSRTQNA